MKKGILDGIRVLDFTWVLAGPYATRILADFGAEVIKVQSKKTAGDGESNLSGYFNTWNRNKRSITFNMDRLEARELALKLATISDVVIENFSPRVMSNWGLNYEKLKALRPEIIMVSLSAMGQAGPWKDFVAFGPTIQALSGLTYLTSFAKDSPIGLGYSYADPIAGLYTAFSVLAALESRSKTGQGEYIDISEYEALCTLLGPALLDLSFNDKALLPQGNQSGDLPAAPYGCYRCLGSDRWCVIAVYSDEEWHALCNTMGQPELIDKKMFSTLSKRKENWEELDKFIEKWTALHPTEKVVHLLQEAGVTAGAVQNAEDLALDPHLRARKFFTPLEHPILGSTISDTSPIKFEEEMTGEWKAGPLLGEGNRYVFIELLGLTESELSEHVKKEIIA